MAKYHKRAVTVDAVKLRYNTLIQTPQGAVSAVAGDWLITDPLGEQRVCPADVFEAMYLPESEADMIVGLQECLDHIYLQPEPNFVNYPADSDV